DEFSDFREGKETALVAYARMTDAWAEIEPHLGAPEFTAASGRAIQRALTECGARDYVEALIDDHMRVARELLAENTRPLPDPVARFIENIADSLAERQS